MGLNKLISMLTLAQFDTQFHWLSCLLYFNWQKCEHVGFGAYIIIIDV